MFTSKLFNIYKSIKFKRYFFHYKRSGRKASSRHLLFNFHGLKQYTYNSLEIFVES